MWKKREKVTEEQAKILSEAYRITGNLTSLIRSVSYFSSWFGRFGAMNRLRFTEALIKELEEKKIEEKKEEKDDHS
jgi:hypothetical protein